MPANGTQKKKLSKGQKKLALQTLREEALARRADRTDAELAASMSTNLENIEHAVHPERLALMQPTTTVKLEDAMSTSDTLAVSTEVVEESPHPSNELPEKMTKAELEEGEILEDLNMNATLPSI